MKKSFIYAGAILAATISLTNCTKEINGSEAALPEGIPFEICANPTTKTTIDGLSTKWAAGDGINVFHAAAGSTSYVSDKKFTIAAGDLANGRFTGALSAALGKGTYDWYAIYPYSEYIESPANTSTGYSYIGSRSDKSQSQTGVDNMSHIAGENYPLYGKSTAPTSASKMPSIKMKPAFSVLKVKVTNTTGSALDVSNISFTAPEAIVGTFYIDFSGDAAGYTDGQYVSKTASLAVTEASIAAGKSAYFYLAVKPFTAKSGSNLTLSVNGYEKKLTLTEDLEFVAVHIKTINFNYDKTTVDNIVTFDFSNPASLGLTKPSASAGTNITAAIVVGDVTLTTTDGGTATRIWNSKGTYDLRVYNSGGSLSFSVPDGSVITRIVFTGNDVTSGYSASVGTLSSGTWTGSNQSVKFTATGTLKISSITVTYSLGKSSTSIISDDITGVSARGKSLGESSYTIENPVDGRAIAATCDGAVVTSVEAEAGTIRYTVSANTTTSIREGSITLTYGDVSKVVKVSQLAPVFKVPRTEVELEAAANSSATITVTSDFDWTSEASSGAGFTSDPATCEWTNENPYTDGKTIVTITASAENASEEGTKALGTLTFTNLSTEETLVVTVTQKTSYVVPSTGTEVTFTMTTSGDFNNGTTATKNGITIAGAQGDYSSNISVGSTYTKVYAGNTLTISGTTGTKIKKVVFTASSSNYIKTWSADDKSDCVVSSSTMTWNNASGVESVVFTNTATAQARVKTIAVTYE